MQSLVAGIAQRDAVVDVVPKVRALDPTLDVVRVHVPTGRHAPAVETGVAITRLHGVGPRVMSPVPALTVEGDAALPVGMLVERHLALQRFGDVAVPLGGVGDARPASVRCVTARGQRGPVCLVQRSATSAVPTYEPVRMALSHLGDLSAPARARHAKYGGTTLDYPPAVMSQDKPHGLTLDVAESRVGHLRNWGRLAASTETGHHATIIQGGCSAA